MTTISPKENLIRAISRCNPEYVPIRRMNGQIDGMETVIYRGAWPPSNGIDRWNVTWNGGFPARCEWEPEQLSYATHHPISDLSQLDEYEFPDPSEPGLTDGLLDGIDRDQVLISGRIQSCLFERALSLVGMENLLIAVLDQQDRVRSLLQRIADYQIVIVQRYLCLGVDNIRATDDYGGQDRLLISPKLWRSLIKPELARIVKAVKDGGAAFWLHSCGHIMEIIPDLVEIGVDILDPIQSRANDLVKIKQLYGQDLSFMGGIDTQQLLLLGNPEMIAQEVKKQIELMAPGGGFILGPENIIAVPEINYRAYIKAGKRFGKYPILG